MKRFLVQILISSLAVGLSTAALADELPAWLSSTSLMAGPAGNTMTVNGDWLVMNSASATSNGDGSVTLTDGMWTAAMWEMTWDEIILKEDPYVSFVGGFTNTTAMAQDFIFNTSTPISPALPSTLYGGATVVTYGDANSDGLGGLANDTSGNPAYTGTIDGSGVLNMLTSLSLAPAFPGDATQSASQVLGLPGPTIFGGAANSTIGITHRFNLSAYDQATFNSTFLVVIPEPGTIALLGAGLGGLALVRRRRQS